MCGKVFERERYLKDHINSVHIKSLLCDFCDYKVAPRRRKRLEEHMRKRHNFPAPPCSFLVPQPAADLSYSHPDVQLPTLGSCSETACDETFAPIDRTFDSSVCNMSESVSVTCITSSPPSNIVSFPVPSRCSTPCQDEHPTLPLFPEFDSPFVPFSPLPSTQPSLQDLIDEPEVAQEAPVTSSLSGVTDA